MPTWVLKDYPENSGLTAQPRPAKHRLDLPRATPPNEAEASPGGPPDDNPPAGNTAKTKRSN